MTPGFGNVTLLYPPSWELERSDSTSATFYSQISKTAIESGALTTPPDVTFDVLDNSSGFSIESFVNSYRNSWFTGYASVSSTTISGRPAVVLSDIDSVVPSEPTFAAFIALPTQQVLLLTGHFDAQDEFIKILQSLVIP